MNGLNIVGSADVILMIGDKLEADIQGAVAAGIPGMLVRAVTDFPVEGQARDLWEVLHIIGTGD